MGDLLACIRGARALNVDETGWRTAGERPRAVGRFHQAPRAAHRRPDRHAEHARSRDRRELKRAVGQLHAATSRSSAPSPRSGRATSAAAAWRAPLEGLAGAVELCCPQGRRARSAVIYRKLSLGSQSEEGERRIERLLSAHATCRLQCRSLFAYLTELLTAHARGDPVPTLM